MGCSGSKKAAAKKEESKDKTLLDAKEGENKDLVPVIANIACAAQSGGPPPPMSRILE